MKKFYFLMVLISVSFCGMAQYYYIPSTGSYFSWGTSTKEIMRTYNKALPDTMSAWQQLPFSWTFYGKQVTGYYISDNGYITFDTNARVNTPNNIMLPNASAPYNAIFALWDSITLIKPAAFNASGIWTYTLGTAPNRIHGIDWSGVFCKNDTNTQFYFGIRLFESGEKKFDIGNRLSRWDTFPQYKTSATAGIQNNDGTKGLMVEGSPDYMFPDLGNDNKDDVLYEFYEGIQPQYDLALLDLKYESVAAVNSNVPLKIKLRNLGTQTITSFNLNYTINKEPMVTVPVTMVNIKPGSIIDSALVNWTAKNKGQYSDIKVWISNLNLSHPDEQHVNDTLKGRVFVNEGISGTKRVLIEEATGTWCGACPGGALELNANLDKFGNLVAVAHHNNDPMSYSDGDEITSYYFNAFPSGLVDRYKFDSFPDVAVDYWKWGEYIPLRLAVATPVNLEVTNIVYNSTNRNLSYDVKITFVDDYSGDLRISTLLTQNWVGGTGGSWDQHNYYSHELYDSGQGPYNSPLYPLPEWLNTRPENGNWFHHHVGRKYLSDVWGDQIDQVTGVHIFQKGSTFTKSFSGTLKISWQPNNMFIVAYVNNYDDDLYKNYIVNTIQAKMTTVDIEPAEKEDISMLIYPNPVSNIAWVGFNLRETSGVGLTIINALGQVVSKSNSQMYAAGNHVISFSTELLPRGVYLLELKTSTGSTVKTFVK